MPIDEESLDEAIARVSGSDPDQIFQLLGIQVQDGFQPQSGKRGKEAGKSFFERFQAELRRAVCKKDGPCDQLTKGLVEKKDLPKLVAIAVLTGVPTLGGVTVTTIVAAYLGLLIVHSGLAAYCAGAAPK